MPVRPYLILAAATLVMAAAGEAARPTAVDQGGRPVRGIDSLQLETPGKVDLESAEILAELIGAPVFAAGGAEVGQVAGICFDAQGRPQKLRMTTGAALGLGTRTVAVPDGAFMALRGAVVLDLPPEAVGDLPASDGTGCD